MAQILEIAQIIHKKCNSGRYLTQKGYQVSDGG